MAPAVLCPVLDALGCPSQKHGAGSLIYKNTYHEVANGAVKDGVIVVSLLAQLDEVLPSFGHLC